MMCARPPQPRGFDRRNAAEIGSDQGDAGVVVVVWAAVLERTGMNGLWSRRRVMMERGGEEGESRGDTPTQNQPCPFSSPLPLSQLNPTSPAILDPWLPIVSRRNS